MKVTNWFKRNRNRSKERGCSIAISSQDEHGQINIFSAGKTMHVTLTPDEMLDIKAQFEHCCKRYQTTA